MPHKETQRKARNWLTVEAKNSITQFFTTQRDTSKQTWRKISCKNIKWKEKSILYEKLKNLWHKNVWCFNKIYANHWHHSCANMLSNIQSNDIRYSHKAEIIFFKLENIFLSKNIKIWIEDMKMEKHIFLILWRWLKLCLLGMIDFLFNVEWILLSSFLLFEII